jgi:hypothetical protein
MGDFNFRARFIDRWCEVFGELLGAELNGSSPHEIEKLRLRYQNLAQIAGPEVTQQFFHEAVSRVGEKAPVVAARLLKELLAKGIIKSKTFTMDEA